MSCGVLISGVLATTVDTMKTDPLLKRLALVAVSILVAGFFHIGWLAAFIPAAKSGVIVLKTPFLCIRSLWYIRQDISSCHCLRSEAIIQIKVALQINTSIRLAQ